MKKKKEIKITKIKIDVRILFLVLIIAVIGNYYLRTTIFAEYKHISSLDESICPLKYSKIECYQNEPIITFYNPNEMNITKVSVILKMGRYSKIYNVVQPLMSREMKSLFLNYSSCDEIPKSDKILLRWCCEKKCYEIRYNVSQATSVRSMESVYNLEKCNSLPTVRKLFCYADVAEITNNISICYMINDNDIGSLCFAQTTLNVSKCFKINDEKLKEACIESVNAKIKQKENK